MFTGIIGAVGSVKSLARKGSSARLEVQAPWSDLALGESVCVDGVCLTVASASKGGFAADVSRETLQRSALGGYRAGRRVNLERALRAGDRLGGHLVYGHVDGVGKISRLTKRAERWEVEVRADPALGRYFPEKASVAVNGVSLTVARRTPSGFRLAIVPHTLKATTMDGWRTGDPVNLEADMVAKYLESSGLKR